MKKNYQIKGLANPKRFRVMLVDDEAFILEMISQKLPPSWKIDKFTDSRAAVEAYNENPTYDIVVTDFKMAPKHGEGLIFDIKYLNPQQKIFVITGDSSAINLPKEFEIKIFEKPDGITPMVKKLIQLAE